MKIEWKGSKEFMIECKLASEHPNIHWLGKVPYEDVPSYHAACDIFVSPARFMPYTINPNEAWGMVVNEAMSLSKPVIVSNAVGASDVVDESNGLKVVAGDVDSLYNAMNKMLDMDLGEMGKASRKKIDETWNFDNMAKGFFNAINYVGGNIDG